jgi:hypothetical protein
MNLGSPPSNGATLAEIAIGNNVVIRSFLNSKEAI